MKKRSNVQTVKAPKRQKPNGGKKDCEFGNKCEYQDEYQHQLEFNHDKDPQTVKSESQFSSGNGNKLGGTHTKNIKTVLDNRPETNSGTKLGGSTDRSRSILLDQFSNTKSMVSDDDIFCESCFQMFPFNLYAQHLTTHRTTSSSSFTPSSFETITNHLRIEQDREYNNSLVADAQKREREKRKEIEVRERRLEVEEEEALRQAVEESSVMAVKVVKQNAIDNLSSEPTAGPGIVQLRFVFPTGVKVVRRFSIHNSVQEAFLFLISLDECTSPDAVTLKHPVGAEVIHRHEQQSFEELGLAVNCNLVVFYAEEMEKAAANRKQETASVPPIGSTSRDVGVANGKGGSSVAGPNHSPTKAKHNDVIELLDSGVKSKRAKKHSAAAAPRTATSIAVVDLTSSPVPFRAAAREISQDKRSALSHRVVIGLD